MPYEGYEYYYGRELVIAIPPHHRMSIDVTYDAADEQALEIKDLHRLDTHLVRFSSVNDETSSSEDHFDLENQGDSERRLVLVGGSLNGRKWWLSTPIVRWKPDGLIVGFSDRHERAMNEASDAYINTLADITFEPMG